MKKFQLGGAERGILFAAAVSH